MIAVGVQEGSASGAAGAILPVELKTCGGR
jgi:hypothetical protein